MVIKIKRENYSIKPAFNEDDIKSLLGEGYKVPKSLSDKARKEIELQGYEIPKSEIIKQIHKKYGDWK